MHSLELQWLQEALTDSEPIGVEENDNTSIIGDPNAKNWAKRNWSNLGQNSAGVAGGGSWNAQERTQRGTDRGSLAAAEAGQKSGRDLPQAGLQPVNVLYLEAAVAGMGLQELREPRQLREESFRLKRLVADLSLDRQILREIVSRTL